MNALNFMLGGYDRKARLYPALLLIAPVIATTTALLSIKLSTLQSLVAVLVGCGGAFLLTQLARDAGKRKEKALFDSWGGLPSVAIFRHRDSRLDAITKARYHKKLNSLVSEAKAPTVEQEESDPIAADTVYSAWSNFLRVNTRDTKMFPLLFQENVSYGYRRNVKGLRPIGIVIALSSCIVCGFFLYFIYQSTGKINDALAISEAFDVFMLFLWLFRFTDAWVRVTADAYAARLAECTEAFADNAV